MTGDLSGTMRPVAVLVCALGGEGGGVLVEWLYGAAVRAGHAAQATSIPGVAQRTGATTYYVEVWPEPATSHPGRRPAFSLSPVPGHIDLLVSSELLETVRQVGLGMVAPDRTTVISSTARALTVAEKIVPTDGRSDAAQLAATLQRHAQAAELLDFSALAAEAGTIVSAVLLGAVAASGKLSFGRADYEDTVRATGKGVAASLRGFALAFDAVT
ncbi:MAG: 2-oxoacid:acceptor oxidoreductase family protein, partial [Rubrivivax sp.]